MPEHLFDAVDARVENVAVKGEAVRGSVFVGWNSATEAVEVDILIVVVELKDVSHRADSLHVLVAPWV